jgi:hypothetical protein
MTIIKSPVIESYYHKDVDTGVFFERQLEFIKARAYETLYPARKAMDLLPVSFEAPEGARSITYMLWDEVGMCKIIAAAADDIPRIDVKAQEFTSPVRSGGGAFGYTVDDIAAANMAGVPLSQRKANAAVKAFNRLVNHIAWNGDASTGLPGLFNNPNIITGTVPAGTGGVPWNLKTPTEILKDLNIAVTAVIDATAGEIQPDTLLLPVEQHALIATTSMSVDNGKTILEFFIANNPWIRRAETLPDLKAEYNEVFATDAFVIYNQNEEFLTLEIPKMFEFLPIERRGLEFIINGHGRIGGTIVYQPLSVAIYDGI